MKILVKTTSLALLALCLQANAAQVQLQPGPAAFLANCSIPGVQGARYLAKPFKDYYNLASIDACQPDTMKAVQDVQTFVVDGTKFNQATQTFVDNAAAQEFVNKFVSFGNLLANPRIFSTNYLTIAEDWLERHVQTSDDRAAALQDIAASVADLTGNLTPPLNRSGLKKITSQVKIIDAGEKKAREFLNELRLTFDRTTNTLVSEPIALLDPSLAPVFPTEIYQSPLEDYIQTTFARRLQNIMPNFTLLPLFNTRGRPLTTTLLSKSKKSPKNPASDFYEQTEAQAAAVITAMADEIRISELTLRNLEPFIGTPAAGVNATLENWADQAVVAITATDAELIRVAGPLAPGFTLPVAPANETLPARATALLNYLSAGGGTAGITAYLDSLRTIPKPLHAATPELAVFQPTIDTTRTDLKYGTGATGVSVENEFEAIRDILSEIPVSAAGATAEDKVKTAITYLTEQLYVSFMWLTKDNGPATTRGVPPFAGDATDVAAATEHRITQLITALETLHAQNAALTTANAAARAAGGALGAETDADVISSVAQVKRLAGQLTPCADVTAAGTAAAELPLLPAALTQMADALANLSAGVAGLPAANGAALATAIKGHITAANPAVAQLATAQGNVTRLTAELAAEKVAGAWTNQMKIDLAAAQAEVARLKAVPAVDPKAAIAKAKTTWSTNLAIALIDQNGGGMFDAFPGGFNLANLTADAPAAGATLADAGNYYRECAEAAAILKSLAALLVIPANMRDLITDSTAAIQAKFTPAAAPAPAAAGIPAAVITGHNASVARLMILFNAVPNKAVKKQYYELVTSLNSTANAINAITPGAQVITLTDPAGVNVTNNKAGIIDNTTAASA